MTRRAPTPALLLAAALAAAPRAARADDWPQQGGTPDRAGQAQERAGPAGAAAWDVATGDPVVAAPVVADGVVVVAAADGTVRGLAEVDGAVRWTVELDPVTATPACGQGRVVVASGAGRVTCLALETGAVVWDRPGEGGGCRAAVAVAGGVAVVSHGFPARRIEALALDTGARRWSFAASQVAYAAPCVTGGRVVVGADDGGFEARDLASGALAWRYATAGDVLLGGAAAGGALLFLLPGGDDDRVHVVHADDAQWGGANRTVQVVDPSAPDPWDTLGTSVATSPPAWTGADVVAVVRFDHVLDLAAPWGTADAWECHERVVAVDPVAGVVRWSAPLATLTAAASHEVPPFRRCPPPVVVERVGGGKVVGFAASLEARLDWRETDGTAGPGFSLPGTRWAGAGAPAVANARAVLATREGRVVALALAGNGAPAAPTLTSAGTFVDAGDLAWTAGADPEDAPATLTHLVRLDDDGEVLLDAAVEVQTAAGTTTLPLPASLVAERPYTARVRSRDPQGALSPWSAPVVVRLSTPVEAPRALTVLRTGPTTARAEWQASPTPSVARYVVTQRPVGGAWAAPREVPAPGTRLDLEGLGEAPAYEVRVVAVSGLGRESPPASATVDGQPPITVGGRTFYALGPALAAARPGDVVVLAAGTFRDAGPVVLPGGVTLRGAGAGRTRLAGTGAGDVLRVLAGGPSRVEALGLFAGDRALVVAAGAEAALERVLVYDAGDALVVEGGARVDARQLTIVDARGRGVRVDAGAVLALASSLVHEAVVGLEVAGQVTTAYCSIAGRGQARVGHAPGATDAVVAPRFLDAAARDYREAPGSPTIDAADPAAPVGDEPAPNGGRANLGAFGGTADAAATPPAPPAGSAGGGCALAPGPAPPAGAAGGWLLALALALLAVRRPRR